MYLPDLLLTLEHKGVELFVKNGGLGYKGPPGAVTETLLGEIRNYKEELVRLIERAAMQIENKSSDDRTEDELPLTPWHGWYLETFNPIEHKWYITKQVHIGEDVSFDLIKKAVHLTMNRYDTFRQRLRQRQDGKWGLRMLNAPGDPKIVLCDTNESAGKSEAYILKDIEQTLSIIDGPVIYVALCKNGKLGDSVVIGIHHMIVDGYSAGLVVAAIVNTYKLLSTHQTVNYEKEIQCSYERYAKNLHEYMNRPMFFARSVSYWNNLLKVSSSKIPNDFCNGQHLVNNSKKIALHIGRDTLSSKNSAFINDSLLIATAAAIANWSDHSQVIMDVENHGRGGHIPGFDLLQVVGPTTFKFPLLLKIESDSFSSSASFEALRQQSRDITQYALGYGFLRYLQPDQGIRSEFEGMPRPQVFFNNRTTISNESGRGDKAGVASLGKSGIFKVDRHGNPESNSPYSHDLVIECDSVLDGIVISLAYSGKIHRDETIIELAESLLSNLRRIFKYEFNIPREVLS